MEQKHIEELGVQGTAAAAFIWAKFQALYAELKKFECPKIVINKRLTATGGRAGGYLGDTVELSAEIFFYNQEEYYREIIPHELAHMVDFYLTKNLGHGPTWVSIMQAYGLDGNRLHALINPLQVKRDIAKGKVYAESVPKMPILGQRVQWTHTTRQKVVTVYRGVVFKLNLKTFKVKDEKTGLEWGIPANTAQWSEVK